LKGSVVVAAAAVVVPRGPDGDGVVGKEEEGQAEAWWLDSRAGAVVVVETGSAQMVEPYWEFN